MARPAHGADSGSFRTLPWTSQREDDEFLYLALESSGDLVLLDALRPEHLTQGDDLACFRISCSYLGIDRKDVRHLADVHVSGTGGIAALVSKFLTGLVGKDELYRSIGGRQLALNAVDLVALLVAELLEPHRSSEDSQGGGQMLERIRAYIEKNLMDPGMSPESIARAHHISVRYLHKLFQNDGTTVGTWIRQRRLDSCRTDLGRLSNRRRTVAAVAQSWGFASPAHFSRLFRQTYGLSPREWQTAAFAEH